MKKALIVKDLVSGRYLSSISSIGFSWSAEINNACQWWCDSDQDIPIKRDEILGMDWSMVPDRIIQILEVHYTWF